jgi:hypothetical protein
MTSSNPKKQIRYLFLDDQQERHDAFLKAKFNFEHANKQRNNNVELIGTHVQGYYEALLALRKETYDVVFLDHDLGDCNPNADYELGGYGRYYYYSGADVAAFIRDELDEQYVRQLTIIVHSVNPDGARNIGSILKDHVHQIELKEIWNLIRDMGTGTF